MKCYTFRNNETSLNFSKYLATYEANKKIPDHSVVPDDISSLLCMYFVFNYFILILAAPVTLSRSQCKYS